MQLDTQRKKMLIIAAAAVIVLIGGAFTIAALKHQAKNALVHQQAEESASRATPLTAASAIEKEADRLFSEGNMTAAKDKYEAAAAIYAENGDTAAGERIIMQLSLIAASKKTDTPQTTDLSNAPIDKKLDSERGAPAPIDTP